MRNHLGGNVKWLFKTGACLIKVAASTGGTVIPILIMRIHTNRVFLPSLLNTHSRVIILKNNFLCG